MRYEKNHKLANQRWKQDCVILNHLCKNPLIREDRLGKKPGK